MKGLILTVNNTTTKPLNNRDMKAEFNRVEDDELYVLAYCEICEANTQHTKAKCKTCGN